MLLYLGGFIVNLVCGGPVGVRVSAGCIGSLFGKVLLAALLGNCAKGMGVILCLLQVVLTSDKLEHGGSAISLCGLCCVVGLGVLVVL